MPPGPALLGAAVRRCERFVQNPPGFFALDLVRHPGRAIPYQAGGGSGGCFGRDAGPGMKQLCQGFILTWGSLLFFFLSFILVAFLKNLWVVEHMDLLARATLVAIAWGSIIAGRPFTLQYARESVPEALWRTPGFIHTGYFISIVWGIIFLLALGASLFRPYLDQLAGWLYHLLATGSMFLGIIFTQWYVHRVRKARQT